ncbi:MAG TPA: hypothetical protein VM580_07070 [Labilithrix sp.]|nr:hypothetical protein [Labilithrix sp.]
MTQQPNASPQGTARALRPVRFDGERLYALPLSMPQAHVDAETFIVEAESAMARAQQEGAALAYGFVDSRSADRIFARLGWTSLGRAPRLIRPLRLAATLPWLPLPNAAKFVLPKTPLLLPFGRERRPGFREITTPDPRMTRLWDRFSIDVGVAIERSAKFVEERVFARKSTADRIFIFEDGDRYVIRAMCIFRIVSEGAIVRGHVLEVLHDRSVAGMRAASHLLGIALREMSDAGAESAVAWSLVHSGSFPLLARHAFVSAPLSEPTPELHLGVRAFDPKVDELVRQRHCWYLSGLDFDDA